MESQQGSIPMNGWKHFRRKAADQDPKKTKIKKMAVTEANTAVIKAKPAHAYAQLNHLTPQGACYSPLVAGIPEAIYMYSWMTESLSSLIG